MGAKFAVITPSKQRTCHPAINLNHHQPSPKKMKVIIHCGDHAAGITAAPGETFAKLTQRYVESFLLHQQPPILLGLLRSLHVPTERMTRHRRFAYELRYRAGGSTVIHVVRSGEEMRPPEWLLALDSCPDGGGTLVEANVSLQHRATQVESSSNRAIRLDGRSMVPEGAEEISVDFLFNRVSNENLPWNINMAMAHVLSVREDDRLDGTIADSALVDREGNTFVHESECDVLARTIEIAKITTSRRRSRLLRRLRSNSPQLTELFINHGNAEHSYYPRSADELKWLGYFIGRNSVLKKLIVAGFRSESNITTKDGEVFCERLKQNESIERLELADMSGETSFRVEMFGPVLENSRSINTLRVQLCDLDAEAAEVLSLAKTVRNIGFIGTTMDNEALDLASSALAQLPLLQRIVLSNTDAQRISCAQIGAILRELKGTLEDLWIMDDNIDDGELHALVQARVGSKVERLIIHGGEAVTTKGWQTLSTLFVGRYSISLKLLRISDSNIGDDGLEALVPGLLSSNLRSLSLSDNRNITTRGWQALSRLLENPDSTLKDIDLSNTNIDDAGALVLIDTLAMARNRTLQVLDLSGENRMTDVVLPAFRDLLCDTSSVSKTFFSNHTLSSFDPSNRGGVPTNAYIKWLLSMSSLQDKMLVAVAKVLKKHKQLDMHPLFEWEFKTLPILVNWFARAAESVTRLDRLRQKIQRTKLSALYQFIRGMPMLYIDSCLGKANEGASSSKRRPKIDSRPNRKKRLRNVG